MSGEGHRVTLFTRVLAVVLAAGVLTLIAGTATVVSLVRDDAEASLVEAALGLTRHRRDAVVHRIELARAQLRTAGYAVEAGRLIEVPRAAEGTTRAMLGARDGHEIFEAARGPEDVARLRAAPRAIPGSIALDRASREVVLTERAGAVVVRGLVDLDDLLVLPEGWTASLVEGAGATTPVVAVREAEQIRVEAPIDDGVTLRIHAPLAPARAAAYELSRRVTQWSALALVPLIALAWMLSRRVTSPIRCLSRAVRDAQSMPIAVPALPRDEVGDLGRAIRAMSERVHRDERALRRALQLGRGAPDATAEYLARVEDALRAVAGPWRVVPCPEAREELEALGASPDALMDRVPDARGGAEPSYLVDLGGARAIPLAAAGREFGVAFAPDDATEDDVRVAELLTRTAVGSLESAALARQARVGEKLAMLSRLSASVAHEMNTPLAFVNANLIALEDEALDAEAREMIADARIGVERIIRIVRDLSSVSAGGRAASNERVDLLELVRDMARMARSRRPRGRVHVGGLESVTVEVDRGRIEQVVLNLVNNALDAAGASADVRVVVGIEDERVIIEVRDNGPGIPEHARDRLFEAFHTSKGDQGTGLGLYISRAFVEAHGGTLELASSGPEGTVFRIDLPRSARAATPASISPPALDSVPPSSGPSGPRILVIDDDPAIVRAMRRWLRKRGEVVATVDPRAGLRELRARPFDLVLCDLDMPQMSGCEVADEIRATAPEMLRRLVIVTGSAGPVPCDLRVVRKPLDPQLLDALLGAAPRFEEEVA